MVLEKTLESPLDCKEIQPVHPKGDQSWVFIGRTGVEAGSRNNLIMIVFIESLKCFLVLEAIQTQLLVISSVQCLSRV